MSDNSNKRYVAMMRTFDPKKDEQGNLVYEEYEPSWWHTWESSPWNLGKEKPAKPKKVVYVFNGNYKPFGTNGKVASLYDTPAKALRYCGKDGYAAEINFDDCLKVGCSIEEQFKHCEDRMLFWGQEADRLKKEMESVNG